MNHGLSWSGREVLWHVPSCCMKKKTWITVCFCWIYIRKLLEVKQEDESMNVLLLEEGSRPAGKKVRGTLKNTKDEIENITQRHTPL